MELIMNLRACHLSVSGLVFSEAPYDSVYSGVWGYNAVLAAEGILFFFVPSVRSVILALLNAVFATMIQAALAVSLKQVRWRCGRLVSWVWWRCCRKTSANRQHLSVRVGQSPLGGHEAPSTAHGLVLCNLISHTFRRIRHRCMRLQNTRILECYLGKRFSYVYRKL